MGRVGHPSCSLKHLLFAHPQRVAALAPLPPGPAFGHCWQLFTAPIIPETCHKALLPAQCGPKAVWRCWLLWASPCWRLLRQDSPLSKALSTPGGDCCTVARCSIPLGDAAAAAAALVPCHNCAPPHAACCRAAIVESGIIPDIIDAVSPSCSANISISFGGEPIEVRC